MKTFITLLIVLLPFLLTGQDFKGRVMLGEQHAKDAIKKAIEKIDEKPFYDTLIKDEETAIAVVEPILFKNYGKKNIINERPYECYLVDRYWYISGTLPKGWKGGVFEIIISSKNGQIIKLIHGK